MSNRILTLLIGLVVILAGVLMVLNIFNIKTEPLGHHFLDANNVKAVEVMSKGTAHPLTFDQQKRFVAIINEAVHTGFENDLKITKGPFSYDKIVIHQFEGPQVTATPYGLVTTQLLMTIPEWNPDGLIREMGPGELNKIFTEAAAQ